MKLSTLYIVYVLLIYMVVTYVYGLVTHFRLKSACSKLSFSGSPGHECIAPTDRNAKCWNIGQNLSCTHCIFGYKPDGFGKSVCKSNIESIEVANDRLCAFKNFVDMPKIKYNAPDGARVIIKYKTSGSKYEEHPDGANDKLDEDMLSVLKQNCFFDLEITTDTTLHISCENVSNGGVCSKDFDEAIKGTQQVRYRPDRVTGSSELKEAILTFSSPKSQEITRQEITRTSS